MSITVGGKAIHPVAVAHCLSLIVVIGIVNGTQREHLPLRGPMEFSVGWPADFVVTFDTEVYFDIRGRQSGSRPQGRRRALSLTY